MIISVPSLVLASLIIIENCSRAKKKSESVKNLYILTRIAQSMFVLRIKRIKKDKNRNFFICTYYQEIRPTRIHTKLISLYHYPFIDFLLEFFFNDLINGDKLQGMRDVAKDKAEGNTESKDDEEKEPLK